jgi:hypothetical protein
MRRLCLRPAPCWGNKQGHDLECERISTQPLRWMSPSPAFSQLRTVERGIPVLRAIWEAFNPESARCRTLRLSSRGRIHAAGGIRTHTPRRAMAFEAIVSAVPPPPRGRPNCRDDLGRDFGRGASRRGGRFIRPPPPALSASRRRGSRGKHGFPRAVLACGSVRESRYFPAGARIGGDSVLPQS